MAMGERQLKVGLRVRDLSRSADLYLRVGFREIPNSEQPNLRYLTFGHTWLILADLDLHGYHAEARERAARTGPLGSGFVMSIPTTDLDTRYALWRDEGLPITLEPEDAGWARIFLRTRPPTAPRSCSSSSSADPPA
jgi:lactoylglutathione lyase